MKAIFLTIFILMFVGFAKADTTADLVGLGMDPALADVIANLSTVKTNAAWFKARNQANSADINVMRVDATDDTVLNADSGDIIKFAVANTPVSGFGAATPVAAFTPAAAANLVHNGKINSLDDITATSFYGGGLMVGTPVSGVTPRAGNISVSGQSDFAGKINSSSFVQANGLFVGTPVTGVTPAAGKASFSGQVDLAGKLNSSNYLQADGILVGTPKAGITPAAGNVAIGGTADIVGATTITGALAANGGVNFPADMGLGYTAFVPTTAATPVAGTNQLKLGYNLVPTAASNDAALLPTPKAAGVIARIVNTGPNAVRIKAGGTNTINGSSAGAYIPIATLQQIECVAASATGWNCAQQSVPTPAGP